MTHPTQPEPGKRIEVAQVDAAIRNARGTWEKDTLSIYTIERDDGVKLYIHTNHQKAVVYGENINELADAIDSAAIDYELHKENV